MLSNSSLAVGFFVCLFFSSVLFSYLWLNGNLSLCDFQYAKGKEENF